MVHIAKTMEGDKGSYKTETINGETTYGGLVLSVHGCTDKNCLHDIRCHSSFKSSAVHVLLLAVNRRWLHFV